MSTEVWPPNPGFTALTRVLWCVTLAETETDTETQTDKIGLDSKMQNFTHCTETEAQTETNAFWILYPIPLLSISVSVWVSLSVKSVLNIPLPH